MLSPVFFRNFINQVRSHVHALTFYFQGEPFLNPDFLNMVKYASENGLYTITSTNAHYLNAETAKATIESGLDKLIISIDGVEQSSYAKYRVGGQLEKVIAGTEYLLAQRRLLKVKHPRVVWQFIVFKHNEHEIDAVRKLAREKGVDAVQIKTAQVYHFEGADELIPRKKNYSRYIKDATGKWRIKNRMLNQCWRMWQSCVVTWDGGLVPCCFDKDAKHKLGDLKVQPFTTIWFGEAYQRFRKAILKGRSQIDICTNCTEGTKVWAE